MRPLWLAGVGLALLCTSFDGFDDCSYEKLLGEWYTLAFATNCDWIVEQMELEVMTANLTRTEDGSFRVFTNMSTVFGCMNLEMTFAKQENGQYLYKCEWGDKTIERVKTDCKSYTIISARDLKATNGKICNHVSLYARSLIVPHFVEWLFEDQAKQRHLRKSQIYYFAKKLACT